MKPAKPHIPPPVSDLSRTGSFLSPPWTLATCDTSQVALGRSSGYRPANLPPDGLAPEVPWVVFVNHHERKRLYFDVCIVIDQIETCFSHLFSWLGDIRYKKIYNIQHLRTAESSMWRFQNISVRFCNPTCQWRHLVFLSFQAEMRAFLTSLHAATSQLGVAVSFLTERLKLMMSALVAL